MYNPQTTRFIRAAVSSTDGTDCNIVVLPTETGALECRVDVPLANKQALTTALDANSSVLYPGDNRMTYTPATDGEEGRFTVIVANTVRLDIAWLLLGTGKRLSMAYNEFGGARFWFEITHEGFDPIGVHLKDGGSDVFHRLDLMVATEQIGDGPAQIAPGWQTEFIGAVAESSEAGDFHIRVRDAAEFNDAEPGYDSQILHVVGTDPHVDPLERMLSLVAFMPPQNGILDEEEHRGDSY